MKKASKQLFFSATTFGLTVGFFAPFNNFFQNIYEYEFLLPPALNTALLIGAVMTVASFLVTFALYVSLMWLKKNSLAKFFISLVCNLFVFGAFILWLQGTVLAPDLGVLDGRPIDWQQYRGPVLINSFIWLALVSVFIVFYKRFTKYRTKAIIILLVMQLVNFAGQLLTQPEPYGFKLYTTDGTNLSTFSPEKNVVMILLDTFQSDVFEQILLENPQLKDELQGFTYYSDVAGGYPTTMPSVPLIMTGEYYLNQQPFQDFIKEAYLNNSLPKTLKEMSYNVYVPCNNIFLCDTQISDSFTTKSKQTLISKEELPTLMKPTAIRYLPTLVYQLHQQNKPEFNQPITYDGWDAESVSNSEITQTDQRLLATIIENASTASATPAFRYYHFNASHPPFAEYTYQGQIEHSVKAFTLATTIIDKLKELNIYDQTMIIILADHGYGPLGYKQSPNDENPVIDEIKGSAMPLLLIKPFNSKENFSTNNTPISYQTFSTDITNYLKTGNLTLTESPIRKFYYYRWAGDWEQQYLPQLDEYIITGSVYNQNSWKNQTTTK